MVRITKDEFDVGLPGKFENDIYQIFRKNPDSACDIDEVMEILEMRLPDTSLGSLVLYGIAVFTVSSTLEQLVAKGLLRRKIIGNKIYFILA